MGNWFVDGRSVRVVGRLRPATVGESVVILAEHIEYKLQ
jgi:hypothetical protein